VQKYCIYDDFFLMRAATLWDSELWRGALCFNEIKIFCHTEPRYSHSERSRRVDRRRDSAVKPPAG